MVRVLSSAGDDLAKPFASVSQTGLDQYELILVRRSPGGSITRDVLTLTGTDFHVLAWAITMAMSLPKDYPGFEPPEPEVSP